MTVNELVTVMMQFHSCVRHENTGDSLAFSEKLGIARSTLYNMIKELRSMGIEIRYSKMRQTFYYPHPNDVEISISIRQNK